MVTIVHSDPHLMKKNDVALGLGQMIQPVGVLASQAYRLKPSTRMCEAQHSCLSPQARH